MSEFRTTRTTKKRAQFLDTLAETGNISSAAAACALSRRTLYDWRAADPAFAAAWNEALEIGLDGLEDEAIRRARDGVDEPVYHGGLRCGTVRKYSDLLLMFLLKSRRPHRYSPPQADLQGAVLHIEAPAEPFGETDWDGAPVLLQHAP